MKATTTILICLTCITGCGSADSSSSNNDNDAPELARKDSTLATGWYYIVDNDNGYKRQLEKDTAFYFIDPTPILTVKHFTTLEITEDKWKDKVIPTLVIRFDKKGTRAWSEATEKYVDKHLALIIDNKLIVTPKVNAQITAGVSALSTIWYTRQDIENFKTTIEREK